MKKEAKMELKFQKSERFEDKKGRTFIIVDVWWRGFNQSSVDFIQEGVKDPETFRKPVAEFSSLFVNNKLELL